MEVLQGQKTTLVSEADDLRKQLREGGCDVSGIIIITIVICNGSMR